MREYHKIQTVFKRNPETKFKTLLEGDYSLPEFKFLKDNTWVFTEKIDGTNIRIHKIPELKLPAFGGRTENAQIPTFLYEKLNSIFVNDMLHQTFPDCTVTLYGEGYGAKIQSKGKQYIPDGVDFVLFDVQINDWWIKREDVEDIGEKLGLKVVPIIGEGNLDDMVALCKQRFNSKWGMFEAEGIVARPKIELKTRSGDRIITKLKFKDFKEPTKKEGGGE